MAMESGAEQCSRIQQGENRQTPSLQMNYFRRSTSLRIFPRDGEAHLIAPTRHESFGRVIPDLGSWPEASTGFSHGVDSDSQLVDDIQSQIVAQAGDMGDRALSGDRNGGSSGLRFSFDALRCGENGGIALPDDALIQLQPYGFWCDGGSATNVIASPVSPLPSDIVSPLSSDAIVYSREKNHSTSQEQNMNQKDNQNQKKLPQSLEYISCLIHLAVFGILGVLTRYLLQKLFGPSTIRFTDDGSTLYLDLPSNMVGSFLMGWLGVVFKGDISRVSDPLAIGLTTGFLGSLTTFSGWNQKMLEMASKGKWALTVIGFSVDMLLVAGCIFVGVDTAKGFRGLVMRLGNCKTSNWKVDGRKFQITILFVLILILGLLWGVSIALLKTRIEDDDTTAQLWLACIVGPPGVWARWFLARLNGRGLGRAGSMKWIPFGTLSANVLAACLMAALATVKKAVNTRICAIIVNGMQLGFLGCLSTVSTFVAEVYAMNKSKHPWRAYVYTMVTIILSFALGTLIFSVPVWAKGYQ